MKLYYRNYSPVINSILFGSIFIWAGIAIDKERYNENLISLLVFFLPLIYSFITNDFTKKKKLSTLSYLLMSSATYLLAVYLYFFNDHTYHLIFLGTFLSSMLYQLLTRYFFKTNAPINLILIISVLSSLSFIPFQFDRWNYSYFGLGIFLWMILNSIIPTINLKHKNL